VRKEEIDMSKFTELLNASLPSQEVEEKETSTLDDVMNVITESEDEHDEDEHEEEEHDDEGEESEDDAADAVAGADDDTEDFDPDEMSDEELADMDKQLSAEVIDAVSDDGEEEVSLSPEEEMEADDMMSVAATTMLVKDQLNAQERAEFLKDEAQVKCAINEGFLTDADVNELMQEFAETEEGEVALEARYNNKMIIKLDAASKKKQLYALAVNVSAAAHNDPDYRKYKKVLKLKKILKTKLERKYRTEANKRMRVYYKRLTRSASPTLNKIAAKA
jgi:hypothetical protein